ncbi:MAG: M48 family metalloprotease [Thiohalomonadaceae bacterium]
MRKPSLFTLLLLPALLLNLGQLQAQSWDKKLRNLDLKQTLRTAKQAFGEVDEKQEIRIGEEASAVLLGAAPLHPSEPLQGYVNQVGRWVALQSERPDLPWKFAVIDTSSINAFAAPGGHVFVTSGLLRQLQSEAELAGVLGHEVAHVLKKHHLDAVQKSAKLDLAGMLVSSQVDERRQQTLQRLNAGFRELYARGLDRDDEFEADRIGVILASRAGYDPYGLPAVLQTLGALSATDSDLSLLFKTHPAPAQRLSALERYYPQLDAHARQPVLAERYHQQTRMLR